MQDIVFRKNPSSPSPTLPIVEVTTPEAVEVVEKPSRLSRLLGIGPKSIVALQRLINPASREYTVLEAARNGLPAIPAPASKVHWLIPKPVQLPQLNSGELRRQLNSPLGKLTLVQGVAIIALFALIIAYHVKTNIPTPTKATVAADVLTTTYQQQFLPTTTNQSVNSVATTEQITDTSSTLPLDVWATPWNLTSLTSGNYHSISAFWGTIGTDGITVVPKADWSLWDTFVASESTPKPTFYLTVTADPTVMVGVLNNQNEETTQIANLLAATQQHGFDGIDIDYEGLGRENRDVFTAYIRELTAAFHTANKKVAVTVEVNTSVNPPMDWYQLGQTVDEVRIMAYDYHSQTTDTPGPITPIGWLQEILQYAQSQIAPSKVVIGLGNYGYDWTAPANGTGSSWTGVAVSADQAIAEASQYKQTIVRQSGLDSNGFDIGSKPEFTYTDPTGNIHDVWYEDTQSIQAEETMVQQFHLAAIIFWTVGLTDPS